MSSNPSLITPYQLHPSQSSFAPSRSLPNPAIPRRAWPGANPAAKPAFIISRSWEPRTSARLTRASRSQGRWGLGCPPLAKSRSKHPPFFEGGSAPNLFTVDVGILVQATRTPLVSASTPCARGSGSVWSWVLLSFSGAGMVLCGAGHIDLDGRR